MFATSLRKLAPTCCTIIALGAGTNACSFIVSVDHEKLEGSESEADESSAGTESESGSEASQQPDASRAPTASASDGTSGDPSDMADEGGAPREETTEGESTTDASAGATMSPPDAGPEMPPDSGQPDSINGFVAWPFDTEEAQRRQEKAAKGLSVETVLTLDLGGVPMEFMLIPDGRTQVGSPPDVPGYEGDEALRYITIPRPFFMGKTQVTRGQYKALMGEFPPNDVNPFVKMSESELEPGLASYRVVLDELIPKLQERVPGGWTVRLPNGDEWEHAARAGTATIWYSGDTEKDLNEIAWCGSNGGTALHDVAQLAPNAWGLYDMIGNIWHWVLSEPEPWQDGFTNLVRGGDFAQEAFGNGCRTSNVMIQPSAVGYRLIIDPP